MSISYTWRQVKPDRSLGAGGSSLKEALDTEFGSMPWMLDDASMPFLRGLRAAKIDGASELLELIEKYGTIELDGQY